MKDKTGIVLINGAGLNSSIWDDLKMYINAPILTIDFPNRKTDGKLNSSLTFDDYVGTTIDQIKNWNNDNFILVVHSIGACVGLNILSYFKDETKGFVAVGSVIPVSGKSYVSSLEFPQKLILPIILRMFGTKPPRQSIEIQLCNDLSAKQIQKKRK